ncbi:MAG: tRNA(Ile)-lysidine synthetase, partial [Wolbachia sp.]
YSLPTVQKDRKVLAYPDVNHNGKNTNDDKVQCIINSTIKQNLVSLISI